MLKEHTRRVSISYLIISGDGSKCTDATACQQPAIYSTTWQRSSGAAVESLMNPSDTSLLRNPEARATCALTLGQKDTKILLATGSASETQ